ncbi:MAG: hypothetical protein HN705_17750 [Rhodospirillales bacterium]|nr:hypothetical protein [Rhodospirillales bacterium]
MKQLLKPGIWRKALLVALVVVMASPLVGCGRKSSPEPPEDSKFPRIYPTQ